MVVVVSAAGTITSRRLFIQMVAIVMVVAAASSAFISPTSPNSQKSKEAMDLNRGAFYRAPGLRYVPDRCSHTYAVITREAGQMRPGGF